MLWNPASCGSTTQKKKTSGAAQKGKLVKNRLEYIQGVLRVDVPVNRSGRLSEFYPEYPVLITDEPSYVHWDDVAIENGAYAKDRFRFVVEPFTLDSLDALGRQELVFEGTLESGDLLPPLQEQLHVMDDLYLGFTTSTPAGGYQVYGGVGTFDQDLTLDGGGFAGRRQGWDFRTGPCRKRPFCAVARQYQGIGTGVYKQRGGRPSACPRGAGRGRQCAF